MKLRIRFESALCYLAAGLICHIVFVGNDMAVSNPWTWFWLLAWPAGLLVIFLLLGFIAWITLSVLLAIDDSRLGRWVRNKIGERRRARLFRQIHDEMDRISPRARRSSIVPFDK